jgi:phage gpG-like protein
MGVDMDGDWDKAKQFLTGNVGVRLALALRQATIKNALLLVREIKRGIRSQAPGGQPFVKLSQFTIDQKGSSKALIDTGFLMNSITQRILKDQAFVGLLRTAQNRSGESMANIGAIMEYGATIDHPGGATIIIPPRPFLHPVMLQHLPQVRANYRDAIKSVFGE